jgi:hypothetical protein
MIGVQKRQPKQKKGYSNYYRLTKADLALERRRNAEINLFGKGLRKAGVTSYESAKPVVKKGIEAGRQQVNVAGTRVKNWWESKQAKSSKSIKLEEAKEVSKQPWFSDLKAKEEAERKRKYWY